MTIDELKSAQEKLGLDHNQMAARMGVKRAQFYNWRSGRTDIPHWVADKIKVAMMEREADSIRITEHDEGCPHHGKDHVCNGVLYKYPAHMIEKEKSDE